MKWRCLVYIGTHGEAQGSTLYLLVVIRYKANSYHSFTELWAIWLTQLPGESFLIFIASTCQSELEPTSLEKKQKACRVLFAFHVLTTSWIFVKILLPLVETSVRAFLMWMVVLGRPREATISLCNCLVLTCHEEITPWWMWSTCPMWMIAPVTPRLWRHCSVNTSHAHRPLWRWHAGTQAQITVRK